MKNKLVLIFVILISIISMFIISNKIFSENNKVVISASEIEKNKSISNRNILAVYVENEEGVYEKQEDGSIPQEGYIIDSEKSVCNNGVKPSWDNYNKQLIINNLQSNGASCYLYFKVSNSKKNLEKLGLNLSTKGCPEVDENGVATIAATETTNNLLCKSIDDYGETYYYRGVVDNNWVKIGSSYWRIIRINGNGTIRLIYNGKSPEQTGSKTLAVKSTYNSGDEKDNKYVGFMYGGTQKSTILQAIESWYKEDETGTELAKYAQYLDGTTGFCNDRQINKGNPNVWWKDDTALGYGTNKTAYAPISRFENSEEKTTTNKPILKCGNPGKDLFTTETEQGIGNGLLTYPIGLITIDEVIYAGGYVGTDNKNFYLYNGTHYWTMSPVRYDLWAEIFLVNYHGGVNQTGTSATSTSYNGASGTFYSHYLRPVINLRADTTFSGGTGTSDDPYVVQ